MKNLIEQAVAPLKQDAIKRAIRVAHDHIETLSRQLAECEGNVDVLAPRPRYNDPDYKNKSARRRFIENLTAPTAYRHHYEPDIRALDSAKIERFVNDAIDMASMQYDAFVAKLIAKIGPVESATLEGNHVWNYSILSVKKNGENENWKTRQIVNVSVHGKLFNQWPTRKVK